MLSHSFVRRAIAAAALGGLCTCGTLDKVDVDASAEAQIPKATLLDDLLAAVDFGGFDDVDFSREIANQGVQEDQIDSVHLASFTLSTGGGQGQTLDFLESLEVHASAEGLPDVVIADGSDFAGKTEAALTVHADVELKPYVVAASMTLTVSVKGKRPSDDTTVHADITLSVDATVPGCE